MLYLEERLKVLRNRQRNGSNANREERRKERQSANVSKLPPESKKSDVPKTKKILTCLYLTNAVHTP